jgi:hypothetical protein
MLTVVVLLKSEKMDVQTAKNMIQEVIQIMKRCKLRNGKNVNNERKKR